MPSRHRPPSRYVADTPLAKFLVEQFGGNPNLSELERASKRKGVPLLASSLSRYLAGDDARISPDTVYRLSVMTGLSEEEIRRRVGAQSLRGPGPDAAASAPVDLTDVIERAAQEAAHRAVAEMAQAIVADIAAIVTASDGAIWNEMTDEEKRVAIAFARRTMGRATATDRAAG